MAALDMNVLISFCLYRMKAIIDSDYMPSKRNLSYKTFVSFCLTTVLVYA